MAKQNWKKVPIKLGGTDKTYAVWQNTKTENLIWIVDSKLHKEKPFRFGGINERGYIKDSYFATKEQALNFANAYMRTH